MKKKIIAAAVFCAVVISTASCGSKPAESTTSGPAADTSTSGTLAAVTDAGEENADVMSHADFDAAELETEVTVETYVQAKQGWWEKDGVGGVATFYTQAQDGAYLIYDMPCSKEDYDKLTPGTKIRVTGFKVAWEGEVEIMDAKFEILGGDTFVAEPFDATSLLGKDELIDHQNELVSFKGMTVEAKTDADGNEAAFLYSYDGSGEDGSDLYFDVSLNGEKYTFTVESYLTGAGTEVYETVKSLNIGDVIDMEGFLYWYNGVNPHITAVAAASGAAVDALAETSADGVMSHDEYVAADLDSEVTVETYVQAKQGWWEKDGVGGVATFYTQAQDGAYFLYDMPCSKEDYDKMTPGKKIKVTGYKAAWEGEVEIIDAKYEIIDDEEFIAAPLDVTALLGNDSIIDHQNEFVSFKGMTVEAKTDASGNEAAFLYSYDGSGEDGSDLYFDVSLNGAKYTFTVESYLTGAGTDVYEAVKALKVGDVIDMEGFLYWYNGANPHITSVTKA